MMRLKRCDPVPGCVCNESVFNLAILIRDMALQKIVPPGVEPVERASHVVARASLWSKLVQEGCGYLRVRPQHGLLAYQTRSSGVSASMRWHRRRFDTNPSRSKCPHG